MGVTFIAKCIYSCYKRVRSFSIIHFVYFIRLYKNKRKYLPSTQFVLIAIFRMKNENYFMFYFYATPKSSSKKAAHKKISNEWNTKKKVCPIEKQHLEISRPIRAGNI